MLREFTGRWKRSAGVVRGRRTLKMSSGVERRCRALREVVVRRKRSQDVRRGHRALAEDVGGWQDHLSLPASMT